jgi:hypothetical protein
LTRKLNSDIAYKEKAACKGGFFVSSNMSSMKPQVSHCSQYKTCANEGRFFVLEERFTLVVMKKLRQLTP